MLKFKTMLALIMSCWKIFRIIFVLFSLYLLGNAFYRWDGFRYYGSFSEFVPSVALITILWTIVAILVVLLIWLQGVVFDWFCRRMGRRFSMEHNLLFICIFFLLSGIVVLLGRPYIFPDFEMPLKVKILILTGVAFAAIFLTRLFRNKAEKWMKFTQERITPLVWLFGIWAVLSVPLVAYHMWGKQEDNVVRQMGPKTTKTVRDQPNIILITFDAMRAQDMSVYGYHKPTTPFIKKWAEQASLFTNLKAVSNQTTVITETLMTGKRPWRHRLYHAQGYKGHKSDVESLPVVLRNNGYYNIALIQNPYGSVKKLGVSNGFAIASPPSEFWTPTSLYEIIDKKLYQLFGEKIREYKWIIETDFILYKVINIFSQDFSVTSTPIEKVFSRFLTIIDNNPPEPFFVWIHLTPPHDPYLPPPPYMGMFDSSSRLRTFETQRGVLSIGV